MPTTNIACRINNGLQLKLSHPLYSPHPRALHELAFELNGPRSALNNPRNADAALTTIDAEFWAAWLADNRDSDLIKRHFVYEVLI